MLKPLSIAERTILNRMKRTIFQLFYKISILLTFRTRQLAQVRVRLLIEPFEGVSQRLRTYDSS